MIALGDKVRLCMPDLPTHGLLGYVKDGPSRDGYFVVNVPDMPKSLASGLRTMTGRGWGDCLVLASEMVPA